MNKELLQRTIDTLEELIEDGLDELMPLYDDLVKAEHHKDWPCKVIAVDYENKIATVKFDEPIWAYDGMYRLMMMN